MTSLQDWPFHRRIDCRVFRGKPSLATGGSYYCGVTKVSHPPGRLGAALLLVAIQMGKGAGRPGVDAARPNDRPRYCPRRFASNSDFGKTFADRLEPVSAQDPGIPPGEDLGSDPSFIIQHPTPFFSSGFTFLRNHRHPPSRCRPGRSHAPQRGLAFWGIGSEGTDFSFKPSPM